MSHKPLRDTYNTDNKEGAPTALEQAFDMFPDAEAEHKEIVADEVGNLSDEYEKLRTENKRLREALKECEAEIDANIDLGTPASVHPKWDSDNAYLKANSPARLALQEVGE